MRIEKLWANFFTSTPKTKEAEGSVEGVNDGTRREQSNQQSFDQNEKDQSQEDKPFTREDLEKAVGDLKKDTRFIQSGMTVHLFETTAGFTVQLAQPNGLPVKTLSADEFLKLRLSSNAESTARGKILDQKF